jgi:hypothetical protein
MEVGEYDFGQLSLNLPHCVAPQTDIEKSTLGSDSKLQLFGFSSAVFYTTVIPEN